jgi:hypothetical protein
MEVLGSPKAVPAPAETRKRPLSEVAGAAAASSSSAAAAAAAAAAAKASRPSGARKGAAEKKALEEDGFIEVLEAGEEGKYVYEHVPAAACGGRTPTKTALASLRDLMGGNGLGW